MHTALDGYFGPEKPEGLMPCPHCHAVHSTQKSVILRTWPRVLVIHFKRLSVWNEDTHQGEKDHTPVEFGEIFEAAPDVRYRLQAVVIHHGTNSGGHYTAFARAHNGMWFHYNDETYPRAVTIAQVYACTAYMLWYQQIPMQ